MRRLYGETTPVPRRSDPGGGGRRRHRARRSHRSGVLHTPGHASHHVALHDETSGALFTGEAIGSYLPWARRYRPALPPPEVDVEAALASIAAMRARAPAVAAHLAFRSRPRPREGVRARRRPDLGRGRTRCAARSTTTGRDRTGADLVRGPAGLGAASSSRRRARGSRCDLDRYDALGSIGMNARGPHPVLAQARGRRDAGAGSADATRSGQLSQPLGRHRTPRRRDGRSSGTPARPRPVGPPAPGCRPSRTTAAACRAPPRPRGSSLVRGRRAPRRSAPGRRAPRRRRRPPRPSPRPAPCGPGAPRPPGAPPRAGSPEAPQGVGDAGGSGRPGP